MASPNKLLMLASFAGTDNHDRLAACGQIEFARLLGD
jgi:hypothetical protein